MVPNAVALMGGLTVGLAVHSAVGAEFATLVFACLFTRLDDESSR